MRAATRAGVRGFGVVAHGVADKAADAANLLRSGAPEVLSSSLDELRQLLI